MVEMLLPERFNAADFFVDQNVRAGRGRRAAVRHRGESLTYQQVADLVSVTAGALLQLGLRAEERVVVCLPDSPEFVAVFFGAIKAGIVPVPVHTMLNADGLRYHLQDSSARALIVHQELLPRF